jgi:nitroreductase
MELTQAMMMQRAVRRLSGDPVGVDLLLECVRLATRAPSGSNAQAWEWIVVLAPEAKAAIAELNRPAATAYAERTDVDERLRSSVAALADGLADAPAVVVACYRNRPPDGAPHHAFAAFYGSIFPAIQNFLLAAQAHGLGATPTTMALRRLEELRAILALPDDVWPCAVIPVGRPRRPPSGAAPRRDVRDVVHLDRFGSRVP